MYSFKWLLHGLAQPFHAISFVEELRVLDSMKLEVKEKARVGMIC